MWGSRDFPDLEQVREYVRSLPNGTVVVSGHAQGVDRAAEETARQRGLEVISLPADWKRYGSQAGYIRNALIVKFAGKVVAFWTGESRGTASTIRLARTAHMPLEIHYSDGRVEKERC